MRSSWTFTCAVCLSQTHLVVGTLSFRPWKGGTWVHCVAFILPEPYDHILFLLDKVLTDRREEGFIWVHGFRNSVQHHRVEVTEVKALGRVCCIGVATTLKPQLETAVVPYPSVLVG